MLARGLTASRGAAGLRNRVQAISNATHNNIDYIGEWHSHPPRCTAQASLTDQVALSKLAEEMRIAGLPAVMLIVAGVLRHQFHILHRDEPTPGPRSAGPRRRSRCSNQSKTG